MEFRQGVLLCLLLLGVSRKNAQHHTRDRSNVVFAPVGGSIPTTARRRTETNVVYNPQSDLRPTTDTDGAIYQKTVNGVSFKIVSMCQEFDTVFKPGVMEFDTLQGGCRFVITFDKNLPTSQTVYTPSPVYSQSSAVNPSFYRNQVAERRREFYNHPVADMPAAPSRYANPAVVEQPVNDYAGRQNYPSQRHPAPPPRQQAPSLRQQAPPPRIATAPRQQVHPPRQQQQRQQQTISQQSRQLQPRPHQPRQQQRRQQQPRQHQPIYQVRAPAPPRQEPQHAPQRVAGSPPRRYATPPQTRMTRVQPQPPHMVQYDPQSRPLHRDPKQLDHLQMEALGLRRLQDPLPKAIVVTPPPVDQPPIPRV